MNGKIGIAYEKHVGKMMFSRESQLVFEVGSSLFSSLPKLWAHVKLSQMHRKS